MTDLELTIATTMRKLSKDIQTYELDKNRYNPQASVHQEMFSREIQAYIEGIAHSMRVLGQVNVTNISTSERTRLENLALSYRNIRSKSNGVSFY